MLSQVKYTGHVTSPVSETYATITFNYATRPIDDVRLGYQAGVAFLKSQELQNVSVANGGTSMRFYDLTYEQSGSGSKYQQLQKVQECRDSTMYVCFPATTFSWSNADYSYNPDAIQNGPSFANLAGFKVADVDGDGRQDFVYALDNDSHCPGNSAIYVGFIGENAVHQMVLNTDGQAPVCSLMDLANHDQAWYVTDIDGDGKPDLLMGGKSGSDWVAYQGLGRPTTSGNPVFKKSTNLLSGLSTPITVPSGISAAGVLLDVNGDGLPDFIYPVTPSATSGIATVKARLMVPQPGGTFGFSPPYLVNFTYAAGDDNCNQPGVIIGCGFNFFHSDAVHHSAVAGDINGDGRADLTLSITARSDNGGTQVATQSSQPVYDPSIATDQAVTPATPNTDKSYWYQFTVNSITPPSGSAAGSLNFKEYWNAPMADSGGVLPENQDQFQVVDLNGDGLTDIFYQDVTTQQNLTTYIR